MPWVNGELVVGPTPRPQKNITPKKKSKVDIPAIIDRALQPTAIDPSSPAALGHNAPGATAIRAAAENALNSAPGRFATSALSKASNVIETPLTLLGAGLEDIAAHRNPFPNLGPKNQGTASQGAQAMLARGDFGKAAQRYSTTSPQANAVRAATGDPLAEYFKQHPSQFSAAAFGEEFLNPGNWAAGRLASLAGPLTRGAARGVEQAATATAKATGAANPSLNIVSRAARGVQGGGGRFGEIATAASRRSTVPPQQAQRAAILHSTNIANAPAYGAGRAQAEIVDQFKNMSPIEKTEFIDRMEYPGRTFNRFSPEAEARITRAVQMQQHFNAERDAKLVAVGLATPEQLHNAQRFVTRRGWTLDPSESLQQYPGEDDLDIQAWAREHGSGVGGGGVRKGTLSKQRTYATRRQGLKNGVTQNPDFDVAKAELQRRTNQERSIRIEQSLQALQKEAPGLIVPKSLKTANGKVIDLPRPAGYVEFTEGGDTRTFGSPTLRNSYVDPAVRDLIGDLTKGGNVHGVSGVAPVAQAAFNAANRAALGLYTGNLAFHGGVNLPGNALRELAITRTVSPGKFAKTLLSREGGVGAAESAGASVPHASRVPLETQLGRTQDLPTLPQRVGARVSQGLEAINSGPLFRSGGIESRLASAVYAGALEKNLAKGMSEAEARAAAVDTARGIVGEPEKVPKHLEAAHSAVPFVGWRRSQLARWLPALAKNPAFYTGTHRGINAYNISRGRGEKASDANTMIPPIEWPKGGGTTKIATPADWALGMLNAAASGDTGKLAQKAIYDVTPLLSLGARAGAAGIAGQVQPGTPLDRALQYLELYKPGTKPGKIAQAAGAAAIQQYSPARQFTIPALFGIENTPDAKPGAKQNALDPRQKRIAGILSKLLVRAGYMDRLGRKDQAQAIRSRVGSIMQTEKITPAALGQWMQTQGEFEVKRGEAEVNHLP